MPFIIIDALTVFVSLLVSISLAVLILWLLGLGRSNETKPCYSDEKMKQEVTRMIMRSEDLVVQVDSDSDDEYKGVQLSVEFIKMCMMRKRYDEWDRIKGLTSSFRLFQRYEIVLVDAIKTVCIERVILLSRLLGLWDLSPLILKMLYESIGFVNLPEHDEIERRIAIHEYRKKRYSRAKEDNLLVKYICDDSRGRKMVVTSQRRRGNDSISYHHIPVATIMGSIERHNSRKMGPNRSPHSEDRIDACIITHIRETNEPFYSNSYIYCIGAYSLENQLSVDGKPFSYNDDQ